MFFKINRGSSATSSQSNKKSSARKKIKSRKSIASSQKKSSDIRSVGKKKIKVLPKKKGKLEETVKKEKIKKTSDLNVVDKRKIQELKKELKNLDKKDEIPIKDAEGRLYCYDENCDQPAVTDIYCRYHYLALWQYLRIRKQLLESKYLVTTIQEILASCGEGALHFLLRDLKSEKTFELATKEMNFSLGREGETLKSETDFDS